MTGETNEEVSARQTREHREKYEALAQRLGVEALKRVILEPVAPGVQTKHCKTCHCHGLPDKFIEQRKARPIASVDGLRAALQSDQHLNNIPLQAWDSRHDAVGLLLREAAKREGLKRWTTSLSETVSVLKHVARYHIVGEDRE